MIDADVFVLHDPQHFVETARQVAHEGDIRRPVMTDQQIVHLQLKDLGVLRDVHAEFHAEIEDAPGEHDDVAVLDRVAPRTVEQQRRIVGDGAAAHAVGVCGYFGRVEKLLKLLLRVRPLHARPRHHHRPLRVGEDFERRLDLVVLRRHQGRRSANRRKFDVFLIDVVHEDVHRDFEKRRARDAGDRVAHGQFDVFGNALRVVAGARPLGDGLHQRDVVHLLQRAPAQVGEGALAADDEDGRVRAPGVGHARHRVGYAGARGDHGDADFAGIQP